MIAYLRGSVTAKNLDHILVDVAGIGYKVYVSNYINDQFELNKESQIYIFENIKEDIYDLYGFESLKDKELFELLLSVKNVGPKAAMAIFNISTSDNIIKAISSNDVNTLMLAKGIGRKAAEQVIVELKNKVGSTNSSSASMLESFNISDEAIMGLMSLGYNRNDAQVLLSTVPTDLSVEDRIKQALKGVVK